MSRKIGEFNVTEFINTYLANNDIDNIDRLIASAKLNSELVITAILKCYKEQYSDRFFDLMKKVMIDISVIKVYETNNIFQYECDKFIIDLETVNDADVKILSIIYRDKASLRIASLRGHHITYLHINAERIWKSLTETELINHIK